MFEKDRKKSCEKLTLLYNSFSDKTISEMTMRTLERLGFRGRAAAKKLLLKPNMEVPEKHSVKKEVPERQLN